MTYIIHSIEQDIAGMWRARVVLDETEAIFLKFQSCPSEGEIQEAAALYVAARQGATEEPIAPEA